MLLEVGFLQIFYPFENMKVPIQHLYQLVAFKLYFQSGVLKIFSGCPTWIDLTALHHHF